MIGPHVYVRKSGEAIPFSEATDVELYGLLGITDNDASAWAVVEAARRES